MQYYIHHGRYFEYLRLIQNSEVKESQVFQIQSTDEQDLNSKAFAYINILCIYRI